MAGKGRVWLVVLFAASIVLLPMRQSGAAYLYNWDAGQKFTDAVGDAVETSNIGRDIVAAWIAVSGDYTYFRVDLASAPVEDYNWGTKFGVYIDAVPGYGAPASNYYVPQIPGIDGRIDSTIYAWPNQWQGKYKFWTGSDFSGSVSTAGFQHSENGGKTLEWKYRGNFGNSFTWYAASMYEGYADSVKCTYDYLATPIPSGAWLLGSGLLGLIGLARRKRRKK